jgi:oligopeptidase A
MANPLLDTAALPRFADITPEHAVPALQELIAEHRRKLAALLRDADSHDFDSLIRPLQEMRHELGRVWSPVGHLQMVLGEPAWREAYNQSLPLMTEHGTEISQNGKLQKAFQNVARSLPEDATSEMKSLLEHELREFRLAGVALPDEERTRGSTSQVSAKRAGFRGRLAFSYR